MSEAHEETPNDEASPLPSEGATVVLYRGQPLDEGENKTPPADATVLLYKGHRPNPTSGGFTPPVVMYPYPRDQRLSPYLRGTGAVYVISAAGNALKQRAAGERKAWIR